MLKLNLENIKYKLLSYGIYSMNIVVFSTKDPIPIFKIYYFNSLVTVDHLYLKFTEKHITDLLRVIIEYEFK